MRYCERCKKEFPFWGTVNGVRQNFSSRRFCLSCSPFKQHNTKDLTKSQGVKECTLCKEIKLKNSFYYGSRKCKSCDNVAKRTRDVEIKKKAIAYKGGKCEHCGYKEHHAPLVFHHLRDKAMTWNMMRNSGWAKVEKELDKCKLLCANCHHIVHSKFP